MSGCVSVRLSILGVYTVADPRVERSHFDICARDGDTPSTPIGEAWVSYVLFILTFQSTYLPTASTYCSAQSSLIILFAYYYSMLLPSQKDKQDFVSSRVLFIDAGITSNSVYTLPKLLNNHQLVSI